MLTFLWTDVLLFGMVACLIFLVWQISRKEHLRRPWLSVFNSKVGVVSLVFLLFFLLVALLDSTRVVQSSVSQSQQNNVSRSSLSLLDIVLTPIRTQVEKTYSAPFSSYAYTKEILVDKSGKTLWVYPRLKYGGMHLSDPSTQMAMDILFKSLQGLVWGSASWLVFVIVVFAISKKPLKSKWSVARQYSLLTLFIIFIVMFIGIELAPHYHIFGTDKVGEDVLYQTLKSIRTGLLIGSLTTVVMLPFAVVLGLLAGFFRGWMDDVIQYIYTTLSSIPSVLLIAAAILMAQVYMVNNPDLFTTIEDRADIRLLLLCLILGLTSWTGLCRLLRAETLKIREMDYVTAARALGVSRIKLLQKHILPNVMHLVMITLVLDFSGLVLAEAVLSYINIGVDPSTYSWGNMINTSRLEMAREPVVWWSLSASFLVMFSLVLAANLFADVVRDAFDPRANH